MVRIEDPRTGENNSITININYLKHMSDVMNSGLLQLINFSKQIPEFAQLEQNDQVELIRAGTREIAILQVVLKLKKMLQNDLFSGSNVFRHPETHFCKL